MHQASQRWRLGLGLSSVTVFLWGILPLALKITLQALDVYTVIWFRFLMAFILLALYLGVQKKLPTWEQLRSTSRTLLAIATLFLASNYFLFLQGLAMTAPTNAEVIIQLSTVLLSFGGLVIFRERYTSKQWLGVAILTLGFVLFFHAQLTNLITAQGQYLLGSGLVVLAAITWAIYALAQKQLLLSLTSAQIMLIIYGGCALLFTPLAQIKTIFTLNSFHFGTLLFCGLNTLIAYGAFAESLAHWPASQVSAVLALAPIITLIFVQLMSRLSPTLISTEQLTLLAILGAFLVVAGSVTIALGKSD
ncbi:MAG TPA: DMT family transporter [Nostocaceae cyanobacterium]|nr:DMT family transporter [Nostocaceae cyanobacterium]